jgi:hypothetical protein
MIQFNWANTFQIQLVLKFSVNSRNRINRLCPTRLVAR